MKPGRLKAEHITRLAEELGLSRRQVIRRGTARLAALDPLSRKVLTRSNRLAGEPRYRTYWSRYRRENARQFPRRLRTGYSREMAERIVAIAARITGCACMIRPDESKLWQVWREVRSYHWERL